MNDFDKRLRAADPSQDVEAPEQVLRQILTEPAAPPACQRAPRRRRVLACAGGATACAALALGVTIPGGHGRGQPFVSRAYAQSVPTGADGQIVHIVESFTLDLPGDHPLHQVTRTESWQRGAQSHSKTTDEETGSRVFSDSEEQLFDGQVIRSWFRHGPPQTIRASDGDAARQIIEDARTSPLERFCEAYRDQQLTDLGIVDFQGRRAHAYRTTLHDTPDHGTRPLAVGAVATYYFDPKTALPVGSTEDTPRQVDPPAGSKVTVLPGELYSSASTTTNVISTWEQLPPTPENLRHVTDRG